MPLSSGEYGGSGISVMFAGTSRSAERWKPAPSQNRAAWTSGGSGNDLTLGSDGHDDLNGGKGRDLLIGGRGADRIVGNSDDDILVAGFTAYDDDSHALAHILEEWTSSGSYALRVANIKNGGGLTEGFRLNGDDGASQTVFNDADTLTGSSALDAFWANLVADNGGALDKITDLANSESGNDTDF